MKRLTTILLLLAMLCGCTYTYPVPTLLPPYVVMLTNYFPGTDSRCTGALVDAFHVLTAAHCVEDVQRAIAPDGQEETVTKVELAEHDMALLSLSGPIVLDEYAVIGVASAGYGYVFGTCPYYWGHMPRQVLYSGMWTLLVDDRVWLDFDVWHVIGNTAAVCGGDSGGVVIQNDKVVGVISAVDSFYPFVAFGQTFYTVPAEVSKEITLSD